jgi:hypothetical protein
MVRSGIGLLLARAALLALGPRGDIEASLSARLVHVGIACRVHRTDAVTYKPRKTNETRRFQRVL